LIFQGYQWTVGWWIYVAVLYVPLTVVLAYPLAVLLGLTPKPLLRPKALLGATP
jgi:hypothetical protein